MEQMKDKAHYVTRKCIDTHPHPRIYPKCLSHYNTFRYPLLCLAHFTDSQVTSANIPTTQTHTHTHTPQVAHTSTHTITHCYKFYNSLTGHKLLDYTLDPLRPALHDTTYSYTHTRITTNKTCTRITKRTRVLYSIQRVLSGWLTGT